MFCIESMMRPKIVNVRDTIEKFIIPEIRQKEILEKEMLEKEMLEKESEKHMS